MKGFDFPVPAEVEHYVLRFKPERSDAVPRPDLFQAWCEYVRGGMAVEAALERVAIEDGRTGKQRVEMLRHLLNATYHLVLDTERGTLIRAYQAEKLRAKGASLGPRPAIEPVSLQPVERSGAHRSLPKSALSVRQPYAHLILEGLKTIEWRNKKTHVRGSVMIYASKTKSEADWVRTNIPQLEIETLPIGVILGQVEIVGCRPIVAADSRLTCSATDEDPSGYAWLLAYPVRYEKPMAVPNGRQPTPKFWKPFV